MWDFIDVFFRGAWGFLQLEFPGTGLSFAVIFIGIFVISFATKILFEFLGVSSISIPSSNSMQRAEGLLRRSIDRRR